jgi:hypothetical protein
MINMKIAVTSQNRRTVTEHVGAQILDLRYRTGQVTGKTLLGAA